MVHISSVLVAAIFFLVAFLTFFTFLTLLIIYRNRMREDDASENSNFTATPESSDNDEEEPPSNEPPQGRNDPTQGLTVIQQRQLLIDILARGGINAFSLQSLCNLKPDIYGAPASEQRRKTQNKVHRWKRLTPSEFKLLIVDLKIKRPAAQAPRARPPPPQPTAPHIREANPELIVSSCIKITQDRVMPSSIFCLEKRQ
jgi:hypothetical protein